MGSLGKNGGNPGPG